MKLIILFCTFAPDMYTLNENEIEGYMKVLLINGSPRDNGNTFTALSEVAKTLNNEGIETEIICIGKQAVQGCIACGMCGRNGARCTFHDDLY